MCVCACLFGCMPACLGVRVCVCLPLYCMCVCVRACLPACAVSRLVWSGLVWSGQAPMVSASIISSPIMSTSIMSALMVSASMMSKCLLCLFVSLSFVRTISSSSSVGSSPVPIRFSASSKTSRDLPQWPVRLLSLSLSLPLSLHISTMSCKLGFG